MDLLGDIVEKEVTEPVKLEAAPSTGFPALYEPEKVSSWKVRLQQKRKQRARSSESNPQRDSITQATSSSQDVPHQPSQPLSEAQRIHEENLDRIKNMSPEQVEQERRELLESLDPSVLRGLLKRIDKREQATSLEESLKPSKAPLFAEVEGAPGTWVGGSREFPNMPHLDDEAVNKALGISDAPKKHVTFEEPHIEQVFKEELYEGRPAVTDEDDIAPQEYQFIQRMDHMTNQEILQDVHFIQQEQDVEEELGALDINDPNFNDKLHQKYFPQLAKEEDKLAWMKNVPDKKWSGEIQDVGECRFDFKGNLVPPTRSISTTRDGLHHHSENPELAGYTIAELQLLSRSKFPAQRCIAIQTLGRILYKLGKQSYYEIVPEVYAETYKEEGGTTEIVNKIYAMFWDLCTTLRITDSLLEAADESKTKNISVRNYAIDALWLWRQGGGDFRQSTG